MNIDTCPCTPATTGRRSRPAPWLRIGVLATLAGFAAIYATPVRAQSRQVPAPAQSKPMVLQGGVIHPVSQPPIESGYVVFAQGKITAVGSGKPPKVSGATVIDLAGKHVYPGLIAADTQLGLTEIGDIDQTVDTTELGRVKPEVRAAVAVNPDSELLTVTRANGILTALTMPTGGLIAGRASLIRMDGWTWEDLAIQADAGLVINWPRTEPIVAWWMDRSEDAQRKEIKDDLDAIEKIVDDAAAYIQARDHDAALATDMRFEAMRPTLKGEKPVLVNANLAGQIESAVAWANRRKLKIVIVGGAQADRVAALLKQHDVPVIVAGIHRMPTRRQDGYDQAFALPANLHQAGVRFCIAPAGEAAHTRSLNHMAGTAAAYGLPRDIALRSVTLSAAEILGVADSLGSLDVGKSATLMVTTGDPLEITSDTSMAFIDGRQLDLGNRHKSMYEKYRQKYRK
jgi:imidazolonepropionase-like amidohydrolase